MLTLVCILTQKNAVAGENDEIILLDMNLIFAVAVKMASSVFMRIGVKAANEINT